MSEAPATASGGMQAFKLKSKRPRGGETSGRGGDGDGDDGNQNGLVQVEGDVFTEEHDAKMGNRDGYESDSIAAKEPKVPAVIPLIEADGVDKSLPILLRNQPASLRSIKDEKERFEEQMSHLPDLTQDQYKSVSIEDFGAAMLRGMGWNSATSDAGTASALPSIPRPALLGLGATPQKDIEAMIKERKNRKDKAAREAAAREARIQAEEQKQKSKFRPGWIQDGSLVSLRGSECADDEGKLAVVTQADNVPGLNNIIIEMENGEERKVKRDSVDILDHTSLPSDGKGIEFRNLILSRLAKEKAEVDSDTEEKSKIDGIDDVDAPAHSSRNHKSSHKKDKKHHKKSSKRHNKDSHGNGDSDDEGDDEGRSNKHKSKRAKHDRPRQSCWLLPGIRVRIMSKSISGGRLYGEKAVVEDIEDMYECTATLLVDDGRSRRIVEGVAQSQLDTALPKRGGRVMIVRGSLRGNRGRLTDRDSRRSRATVEMDDTLEVLTFDYDDLAELVIEH